MHAVHSVSNLGTATQHTVPTDTPASAATSFMLTVGLGDGIGYPCCMN
jgi:hypothetical protein